MLCILLQFGWVSFCCRLCTENYILKALGMNGYRAYGRQYSPFRSTWSLILVFQYCGMSCPHPLFYLSMLSCFLGSCFVWLCSRYFLSFPILNTLSNGSKVAKFTIRVSYNTCKKLEWPESWQTLLWSICLFCLYSQTCIMSVCVFVFMIYVFLVGICWYWKLKSNLIIHSSSNRVIYTLAINQ